jgi:hypothetical protein
MKLSRIGTVSILLLALMGFFQNCSQRVAFDVAVPQPQLKDSSSLLNLISEINSRDLSCVQASDCVALAVGAKACGGPTSYVVASTHNPEFDSLKALITELTEQERAESARSGAVSNCSFLMEPAVACEANLCTSLSL